MYHIYISKTGCWPSGRANKKNVLTFFYKNVLIIYVAARNGKKIFEKKI